jgi:protein SCO1/2
MGEPETPRRNLTAAVVPALAAAALAAVGAMLLVGQNGAERAKQASVPRDCIIENADGVGGAIDLLDSNGSRVTQADFAGEPAVIYFGFTHCPDICPTSMYAVAEALAQPGGYDVQPILITVDPERDTPARMGEYVRTGGFPEGLSGLSGTRPQIDAAASAFQVTQMRMPPEAGAPADQYAVNHSSMLYVVDANWRTVSIMQTLNRADPMDPRSPLVPASPQAIAACIAAGLERAA